MKSIRLSLIVYVLVLLTAALKDDEVVQALKLGATGVVLKESEPGALLECVRRVHQGEQWIDRETLSRAARSVYAHRLHIVLPHHGEGDRAPVVGVVRPRDREPAVAQRDRPELPRTQMGRRLRGEGIAGRHGLQLEQPERVVPADRVPLIGRQGRRVGQ